MSIILVKQPGPAPVDLAEWTKLVETDKFYNLNNNNPVDYDFSGNTVKKGVLINIGGSNYQVVSDEAITGTPSDYVVITPSGDTLTATASYQSTIGSFVWNDTYNFYSFGLTALIFDEAKAVGLGVVTVPKTKLGVLAVSVGYFQSVNTGYGDNHVVPEDVYFDRTVGSSSFNLPLLDIKQTGIYTRVATNVHNINLPATGTYSWSYVMVGSTNRACESKATAGAGTLVRNLNVAGLEVQIIYRRIS